jgi:hypothetical protein
LEFSNTFKEVVEGVRVRDVRWERRVGRGKLLEEMREVMEERMVSVWELRRDSFWIRWVERDLRADDFFFVLDFVFDLVTLLFGAEQI